MKHIFAAIIFLSMAIFSSSALAEPNERDLKKAFSGEFLGELSEVWKLIDFEVEVVQNYGTKVEPLWKYRFNGEVKLIVNTYVRDHYKYRVHFLKQSGHIGEKVKIFGIATADLHQGKWRISFNLDESPFYKYGKPIVSYKDPAYIIGTPEANSYIDEMKKKEEQRKKKEEQRKKEYAEKKRQKKIAYEKEKQERMQKQQKRQLEKKRALAEKRKKEKEAYEKKSMRRVLMEVPVRRGQGTDYKILRLVRDGDKVELLEENYPWARIRLKGGTEGWMPKRFLSSDAPLIGDKEKKSMRRVLTRARAEVPLRRGQGTDYKIVRLVKVGDLVELLEETDAWARVRVKGGAEGWMPKRFLSSDAPPFGDK